MNADNSQQRVEVELGSDILSLIESLYKESDTQGLTLLHIILTKLIMSDIQDTTTSFIDLAEYCQSLVRALGGSRGALNESKSMRGLIAHDLGLPEPNNPPHTERA